MSKGILIDVGFKADIKDFIKEIEKDLQKVDFDSQIGLSKEFSKQAEEVRGQLSKLKKEIDETINGKIPNDPSKQLQSLNKAVNILTTNFKELIKSAPNMNQGMLGQLDEITGEVGQLSNMCTDAANAVKDLKSAASGNIQFVDKTQKKNLEDTFKLLERARQESEKIGMVKNQLPNKAYEDSDDALRDLINTYQVYAQTMKKIIEVEGNTKISDADRTKELDTLNSSLVRSITNLSRMITTYSKLDKEWNKLRIFNNSKTTLETLQYNLDEPLQKALDYISKRKVEIQKVYSDLGYDTIGYKELIDMFEKGAAKDDKLKIPVALGISTRATTLRDQAIAVINKARENLSDNPLEVEVRLISAHRSKANQKVLKEIRDGLNNINDEEMKSQVSSLVNNMQKQIDDNLLFSVGVNTEKATQAVKDFVKESKEELEQLNDILKLLESVDDKNTKKVTDSLSRMKTLIEEIKQAVDDKTLAFTNEETTVETSINNEISNLNRLYQGLSSIEIKIKEVSEAFKFIPETFQFNLDNKTLESLSKLSDHEALSKLADAKSFISSAISSGNGTLIEIPDDQKQQLLNDIQKLSTEINTIFETKGLDNWSTKFLSSLNEISNKIKTLFGNNALNDMIEQWNMSDEHMISISGKDHIKERSALIADGKIYNSATHDQKGSSQFLHTTLNEVKSKVNNIQSMIGVHSHGRDRIVASSLPQGDNINGDLNAFYSFFKEGVEKQLTIALNDIELFDAKGFFESNNSIDFSDERIRKLIDVKRLQIKEDIKNNFFKYFQEFVEQYGSKDGLGLKDTLFSKLNMGTRNTNTLNLQNEIKNLVNPELLLENFLKETKKTNSLSESLYNALIASFDQSKLNVEKFGYSKKDQDNLYGSILTKIKNNIKKIMDDSFGISKFDYVGNDVRDLATFNFRQETPRILKEALEGTGYKNNYQDFMKVFTTEEFIEQNPLGLSSGTLSDLFDNAAPINFLQTLDKIVEDLKEIKNISLGESFQGAFNVKIDNESVNRFAEEINRLIESIEKLPKIITDAFSSFESALPKDPIVEIDKQIQRLTEDIKETESQIKELEEQLKKSSVSKQPVSSNVRNSVVRDEDGIPKQDLSLYKNLLQWRFSNQSKIRFGETGLPEQGMAANIYTGYATNANIEGYAAGLSSELINKIIQNATEEINTFIHSHPEESIAAFSFDDIKAASELLSKNITNQIVVSLNDLAMLDVSMLSSEDLVKISEKMKELTMVHVPEISKDLIHDEKALVGAFNSDFDNSVKLMLENVITELEKTHPSINILGFEKELFKQITESSINTESYDDIFKSLKLLYDNVAKSFNIKDQELFGAAWGNSMQQIMADFQEKMLKQAVEELSSSKQLSRKVDFSDIYRKFSIEEFTLYSKDNLLGKQHNNTVVKSENDIKEENNELKENISELEKKKELLAEIFKLYRQNSRLSSQNQDNDLEKYFGYLTGQLGADGKSNMLSDKDFDGLDKYIKGVKNSANTRKWNKALNDTSMESLMSMIPNQDLENNNASLEELNKLREKHKLLLKQVEVLKEQKALLLGGSTKGSTIGVDVNPEVVSIINALTEAIQKLLDAGNTSDKATKLLTELNKAINNLGGKTSADKIAKIATNLENFQKSIQALDISDSGFINSLSSILDKGEELKALGEVLKSTKKQIDEAGKAVKAQNNIKQSQKYLEQYENDIRAAVNNKFGGENVLYQQLQATKDGVVQVTAMVQEGENAYKKYILTATNGSDLMVKATNDNAAAISKEIKQWKAYQKLKELAVPGARNLGEEGVTFTPDSSNWDQLVDKAHEFGIEVKDIVKIIRNVDEIGQESFQIFTKLSRVTVGMDSNGVLFQRDEVLDINKLVNDFIKNVDNLQKSLGASFKGNNKETETFINNLKEIQDTWEGINSLHKKGLISDDAIGGLSRYFNAFKDSISSISLDKISTDKKTPEFIESLSQARMQLESVQTILEKVNVGQMISDDDIAQITKFINQMHTLYSTMGDKDNKLADQGTIQKTLGKIADVLAKNSAMSKDLKNRFKELSQEIHAFGENIPADKMKEFTNRFEALKTEMLETRQTGLSFFDSIWQRAKSMSKSFISMYFSLWDIIRYIRTGVGYIKELDAALTEMRKVSDESVQSLKNFQKVSFDIANNIGATAAQIQNSTADFMRLGYSLKEAAELAEDANIYANVGDMEIDEATEHMISSIKAWESEFESEIAASEAIIDRYNEIGNNFAISSADIGSAMERSAAALKAGGNTLNESLGLITAGEQNCLKFVETHIYRTHLIARIA